MCSVPSQTNPSSHLCLAGSCLARGWVPAASGGHSRVLRTARMAARLLSLLETNGISVPCDKSLPCCAQDVILASFLRSSL